MHKIFWLECLKRRDHLEDLGIDGKIILQRMLGKEGGRVDWNHLAQDRNQWRVVVNTVISL
jgi:hypothetical protein